MRVSDNNRGHDFLFSEDGGFINGEDGEGYRYSDGSGYFHGKDGSEGYIYSDGSGYYHGADGSDGYIYSDGSGYYHGADGSDGYKYSDGSGYYHGADGSDGYKYSDGSGYFNGPSDSLCYDSDSDDDADYSSSSDDDFSGADLLAGLLGIGIAAKRSKVREEERERQSQIQYEENLREQERKEKIRERRKKRRAWYRRHWKGLFIVFFVMIIVGVISYGLFQYKKLIPVGYDSSTLLGKQYDSVVNMLEVSGFTDVYTNCIYDLPIESISKENIVTEVKIGDDISFTAEKKYSLDTSVEVTYHMLASIQAPIVSKEAKGKKYKEIIKVFEDAGFIDIKMEIKYDIITGWLTDDGEVEAVSINDDSKYSESSKFRPDAKVVITYHTYKKNKPK